MTKARKLADLGNAYDDGALSNRNLIINGSMIIDQRNGGSSITPTNNLLTLDRWKAGVAQTSKFSLDQDSESPAGFNTSMKVTSLTAYTPSSNDHFFIEQEVEGYNTIPLALGSSDAKDISISFWVRSSLTGTFAGSVINSARNRSRVFEYTINTANTWEYKTVSFAGDTTGTWLTTSGKGVSLRFNFGAAGTWLQDAGSWSTGNVTASSGSVNLVATNNATLYITGVQLEVGDTATPFEHRSYGDELAKCQRYYQQVDRGSGIAPYSNIAYISIPYITTMRAIPTFGTTGGLAMNDARINTIQSAPHIISHNPNISGSFTQMNNFSGLVQNSAVLMRGHAGTFVTLDAEL